MYTTYANTGELTMKDTEKLIKAAEAIFNHFGGLDELAKWENAEGEPVKTLVEKYQKLKANYEAHKRI